MKFWDEVLQDISIFSPTVAYINNLITKSIKITYPGKLNFLDSTTGLFIKGKVIEVVYAERSPKNDDDYYSFWPVQYVKVKVIESIGNEFNKKEINIVVLSRPFLVQREKRKSINLLKKNEEYFIPIGISYGESSFKDEFYINENKVNDNLNIRVSELGIFKLDNDNYQTKGAFFYPKYNLGKGDNKYSTIKNLIEEEISFLKSGNTQSDK